LTRKVAFLFTSLLIGWGCGNPQDERPPGRLASVVFDIDGTLTTGAGLVDFFTPRPDAARAVALYVDKGYFVVYLSARPWIFRDFTEVWLRENGFPELPLYVADQILLDEDRTVAYKLETLLGLMSDENRMFQYGYGDSTTDFEAYNRAGIPVWQTFALLCRGESSCQDGFYESCLSGYTDHLEYIEDQPNRFTSR
jgi:phosphatidate phosphatase PAH1